jgi:hypothetical protein
LEESNGEAVAAPMATLTTERDDMILLGGGEPSDDASNLRSTELLGLPLETVLILAIVGVLVVGTAILVCTCVGIQVISRT